MQPDEQKPHNPHAPDAHHTRIHRTPVMPAQPPFQEKRSRKWVVAAGSMVIIGLVATAIIVKSSTVGRPWMPPHANLVAPPPPVEPVRDGAAGPPGGTSSADKSVAPAAGRRGDGPNAVITVPSAGLRSAPSLRSKALKTVVKENEKVRVLKRVSSDSGPDWVQIETASGRTGWVWASVVKEGKGRRRG